MDIIPFLDLRKINAPYEQAFQAKLNDVMQSGWYILGEQLAAFETEYANYCGTQYALGVANGLDALTLILKGYLELGVLEKGSKIAVPSNTFIATFLSVLEAGLIPVFVEPDPNSFLVDLSALQKADLKQVSALVLVHLYGQITPDYDEIIQFAKTNNILVIEDAAQAHGASFLDKKAGSLSDAAAFSFYPGKNLGCLGDGGAITTNNKELYNCIKQLRNYGMQQKYQHDLQGVNSRLDELQAAFLRLKLPNLDADNAKRRQVAKRYLSEIKNPNIELPFYDGSCNHVFHLFVIKCKNRDSLQTFLKENSIETLIHYPIAPHKQKAMQAYANLHLPLTEELHKTVLSLPISPVMSPAQIDFVIEKVNAWTL